MNCGLGFWRVNSTSCQFEYKVTNWIMILTLVGRPCFFEHFTSVTLELVQFLVQEISIILIKRTIKSPGSTWKCQVHLTENLNSPFRC